MKQKFFLKMYFGLQDTKPPPCLLHLTKQGGTMKQKMNYTCRALLTKKILKELKIWVA
jgi:hypothetical protein